VGHSLLERMDEWTGFFDGRYSKEIHKIDENG
jgi:hypothetical protein